MKKPSLLITLWLACASALQAATPQAATIATEPSPLIMNQGATLHISTADLGSDVYLFTWIKEGYPPIGVMQWQDALQPKYKMEGSAGEYSISIPNLQEFYGFTDAEAKKITKIGFIARSATEQTEDLVVDVIPESLKLYSGGTGTASDPYILATADDLHSLASSPDHFVQGTYFVLDSDIAPGYFGGIGSPESPFCATIDGRGHLIKDFTLDSTTGTAPAGLISVAGAGASITRLGVCGASVSGTRAAGILVGEAREGSSVSRCYTTGSCQSLTHCAGGLVGINSGTIADCYSQADATSVHGSAAGGLVGKNMGAISNCYATGEVCAHNYAGGLAGANYSRIDASVAINHAVHTSTTATAYAGRFGGNNNRLNSHSGTMAWKDMGGESWTDLAHHATDHSEDLAAKATYQDLGWDFDLIWEWRSDTPGGYPFALLRDLSGQTVATTIASMQSSGVRMPISSEYAISHAVIITIDGRTVAEASADIPDRSQLLPGIYMMHITDTHGNVFTRKFVKK